MRTVEKLDIANPEHSGFMYDLGTTCKDSFLNDHQNDIILMMNHYEQRIKDGSTVAFLCKEDGENVGIVWVEIDIYQIGRLRAGMMPEHRRGMTAAHFLKDFIAFCFKTLNLRKLDAEIEIDHKNRGSRAAEKLLRRFGFEKEGLLKEALIRDGKPRNTVLLALLRSKYRVKHA